MSKKTIPVSAAEHTAKEYGYDQVVIIARKVGENGDGGEHVTTYGVDDANCKVAAKIGDYLKCEVMKWQRDEYSNSEAFTSLRSSLALMIMYAEDYLESLPASRGRSVDDKDAWQGHLTQVSCSIGRAKEVMELTKEKSDSSINKGATP